MKSFLNSIKKIFRSTLALVIIAGSADAVACTSAIIGADANPYGRPILWKHRDTSEIDNKVEYVPPFPGEYGFVALFNSKDRLLKEAWMGMNDVGFAIMNTASYNIKDDKVSSKKMDKEGVLMAKALKKCKSVEDFAAFLDNYLRPMGVEANFGVIDAAGNGAYFETNNHSYKRYDLKDAKDHVLIRTNYSQSGRPEEGFGFVREASARHILAPYIAEKAVTPEVLTEEVSRSFYHDMIGRDFTYGPDRWVVDQDFIPRYKSTATVAIEGCLPVSDLNDVKEGSLRDQYIMWTGVGYPPCSEIRAVRCSSDGVDKDLRGTLPGGHCVLGDKARKMRDEVFPIKKGNGEKYLDIRKLYNDDNTGYAQQMKRINAETYKRERIKRDGKPAL